MSYHLLDLLFPCHLLQQLTLLWTVLAEDVPTEKKSVGMWQADWFLSARNMCRDLRDSPTSILLARMYLNWELHLCDTKSILQQKGRRGMRLKTHSLLSCLVSLLRVRSSHNGIMELPTKLNKINRFTSNKFHSIAGPQKAHNILFLVSCLKWNSISVFFKIIHWDKY